MINQNDKLELIKKLQDDSGMEMNTNDLEKLLEEELAKPEAEMDAELIAELLALLETSAESEQAKRGSWKRLEKKLAAQNVKTMARSVLNKCARTAAVLALLLAFSFGMFSTAQAFDWKFLLKLFEPLAETFQLYTNNRPEENDPVNRGENEVYVYTENETQMLTYATLEEFPDELHGYPVKTRWMPANYSYFQGSSFEDSNMATITVAYSGNKGKCVLTMTMYFNLDTIAGFDLEKMKEQTNSEYVAGYPVTFYYNSENSMLSASWINDAAHYMITGAVSEDEMKQIIEELNRNTEEVPTL